MPKKIIYFSATYCDDIMGDLVTKSLQVEVDADCTEAYAWLSALSFALADTSEAFTLDKLEIDWNEFGMI